MADTLAPTPDRPLVQPPPRASILTGSLWMVGLSLLLFFVPLLNGLIGGLVGGYKVRGVGRALTAAVLPAGLVALGLWLLFVILDLPVVGAVAGLAVGVLILAADVGLFLGALVGGALGASARPGRGGWPTRP